MELRNLQTFHVASKCLNYSKTAQQLNFSQPAVTKQIHMLEEELDIRLFMRIGNKMYLTPAGELLQKYTAKIFSLLDELTNEMHGLEKESSSLNIGADISFITNNLQPVISQFYQVSRSVKTTIFTWNSLKVINGIQKNEIDVGFISGNYEDPNLVQYKISSDPIVLIISPALTEQYTLRQIKKKYPFICYNAESPYAQLLDAYINKNKLKKSGIIEFSNLEAVKSAALQGVGVTALTMDIVHQELKDGKLEILENNNEPMFIDTYMIYHKQKASWPAIQLLQQLVKECWCYQ